jgi:hypothetical protein
MRKVLLVPMVLALSMSVLAAKSVPSQTPAASQSPAGFPAPGGLAIVKLVSPGAEPRKALRYVVPAGTKARIELSTDIAMHVEAGGMSMPMKMPGTKIISEVTVSAVAPNGDMTFATGLSGMSFDTAGVDPAVAAAMAGAPDVSSIKATGTMTSRGMTTQQFDLSKVTDPQLKQVMENAGTALQSMSFPLPEEPVGVGARWEVRQRMSAAGLETLTTQTVELVAIEGTKLTLKVGTEQNAPPQTMKNPALPPEAEINLIKMTGTGTATNVLDLASFSIQGEGTMSMSMQMVMRMAGMEQPMSTTMTMQMKMTPVK